LLIIIFITWLVYRGIRESRNASNIMVGIKLTVVLLVIAVGAFYVQRANWTPFMPNGIPGVLRGVSAVFFAYIGFDAISTTAEECKNPQRDLPRAMMWAIIICTILYVTIALVLTGMVPSGELSVGELGQPRIWMSMSRDGLLPKHFSRIHPKFRTPSFATIVTGFVVAVPALFMNLTIVTDLCSIGTLFAFVLVCAGVLKLETLPNPPKGKFKTPYVNSKFILPVLFIVAIALNLKYNQENTQKFFRNEPVMKSAEPLLTALTKDEVESIRKNVMETDPKTFAAKNSDLAEYLGGMDEKQYQSFVNSISVQSEKKFDTGWNVFKHKIPTWIFLLTCVCLTYLAIRYNLSLIPLLGLICCLYMMSELGVTNWFAFGIWLVVGLIIYFSFSYKNSKLNREAIS